MPGPSELLREWQVVLLACAGGGGGDLPTLASTGLGWHAGGGGWAQGTLHCTWSMAVPLVQNWSQQAPPFWLATFRNPQGSVLPSAPEAAAAQRSPVGGGGLGRGGGEVVPGLH